MIRLEDLTLAIGNRVLLDQVSWHLRPGERVGLVGANGTGKSTLLRCIAGELEAESGTVSIRGRTKVGYLPQHAVSGSQRSLWQEARSGMTGLLKLERRLERTTAELDGSPDAIAAHAAAEEAFSIAGGYAAEERIGEVLHGLGFGRADWERSCAEFSGGWQVRIALARLLLSEPDILLLDEPTNHLDMHARSWLADFLGGLSGAVVLVSHDRHVLDRCATAILELRERGLERYVGGFTAFLTERAVRDETREATRKKQLDQAAHLQTFVDRFGAKANKAAQARSKAKALDRIEVVAKRESEGRPRLQLSAPAGGSLVPMSLEGVSFGYGEQAVLSDVGFELHRGWRVAVLGPNGTGKSTLLRLLGGELRPETGQRKTARGVRVARYEQDQAQALPPDQTPLELVLERVPFATELRARSTLGALGLSGGRALQPIRTLSGGEKARVALAAIALSPAHVLLLDEPTNHLDVITAEVLAQALGDFDGALVFVSHDRRLVERLATHVIAVGDGRAELREGLRPEDLEVRRGSTGSVEEIVETGGGEDYRARKEAARARERAERELAEVEARVHELEGAVDSIDRELAERVGDADAVTELLTRRQGLAEELERALGRWEELGEVVEG